MCQIDGITCNEIDEIRYEYQLKLPLESDTIQ